MICARPACFGFATNGKLCRRCDSVREAAFIVGLCLAGSALIVAVVKLWA